MSRGGGLLRVAPSNTLALEIVGEVALFLAWMITWQTHKRGVEAGDLGVAPAGRTSVVA